MARAKGSMKLGENIEPQIGAPLDARTLVKTKADLTNPKSYEYAYVGMEVMVKDELTKYVLKTKDTTDENSWEPVGGGNIDPEQLEGLATKEELKDYVKREELENYATKDELDDVGGSTPKAIPVPIVDEDSLEFTYDGTPKRIVFTNIDEKDVVIIDNEKTDAGNYTCKVYPKGLNVWIGDRDYKTYEYNWKINPIKIEIPDIDYNSLIYNGESQNVSISEIDNEIISVSGDTSGINAGEYTITFSLINSNYIWEDNDALSKNIKWYISKAESQINIDKESITLNNQKSSDTFSFTVVGDGVVSVDSSDITIATVDGNNSPVTVTNVDEKNGSIYITVSISEGNNYLANSNTIVVNSEFLHVVTWANGSDQEIADMIQSAYDGNLEYNSTILNAGGLYDYWAVGDERTMKIIIGEEEKYITLVLEETGDTLSQNYSNDYYKLYNFTNAINRNRPWFIVGTKNTINTTKGNASYMKNDGLEKEEKIQFYGSSYFDHYGSWLGYTAGNGKGSSISFGDLNSSIKNIKCPVCYAHIFSGHGFGEQYDTTTPKGKETFNITTKNAQITRHALGELLPETFITNNSAENTIGKLIIKEKKIKQFTYYKNLSSRVYKKNDGIDVSATSSTANDYPTRSLGLTSLPSNFDSSDYDIKPTHAYAAGYVKNGSSIRIRFASTVSAGSFDFIFAI